MKNIEQEASEMGGRNWQLNTVMYDQAIKEFYQ